MSPLYQRLISPDSSLVIYNNPGPTFDGIYHYHPELELSLICDTRGLAAIGENIHPIFSGDTIMLGPNIPHYWSNEGMEFNNTAPRIMLVFKFTEYFLGSGFLEIPECQKLREFIRKAGQGIRFLEPVRSQVSKLMLEIEKITPSLLRLSKFLELLSLVTETQHLEILSDQDNCFLGNERQNERIDKVYKYVMKNSSTPISLTEVAKQIHMSTEAFCRFFKRSTGNTLNEFIQKTRLARVCQDLIQSELSITEIAFNHGFNNLSNFNRQFRKHKKMTPREYRKFFQESPSGTPTEHLSNKWEADIDLFLFGQNSITSC